MILENYLAPCDFVAARQVLPAEEPLDVSHVRDEPPSVNRQRSTERDDATPQQRRPARSREDEQLDAAEDEGIEDEAPRRRASRPRSQAVPRRRPREDELEDADELDEDDFEDDEALRRRARRSRTEVAPRRHARAADVEDFDALDEDEFDDDEEYLQAEPPLPRRRVEAKAPRHGRGYDRDDDVPVRRGRQPTDAFDEFDDEDIEDAPPPRRLAHRSHGVRARRPVSRAMDDYDRDEALDEDRQIRRVRGARQAEALDAFRAREARRIRRQDQYEEMPARGVRENAVERELDDEPTQKLRRSQSQEDQQHELHTRHARHMAAKLGQMDALDDALSHGDAEDSLPVAAMRNRHNGHGDAEDSLPATVARHGDAEDSLPATVARTRHNGHRDAEDSLPATVARTRHNGHRDAEDSLPGVRRMQHQHAPSARHTADAQDALDDRNVEESAQLQARGPRAQQPPSNAHDELDALE